MTYLFFVIRSSFDDFARSKLRTLLTSLGIMIGIFSVVILIAMGLGFQAYVTDQFKSLGANLIMITPGNLLNSGGTGAMMESGKFDKKDVSSIEKIHNIALAVPIYITFKKIQGNKDTKNEELIAGNPDIFPLMNFKIDVGRLFDKADDAKGSKVIVLGSKAAENLFDSKEGALGKVAKIEDQGYKIIGILQAKGGGGIGPSLDDHVFIPMGGVKSFNPSGKYWGIYIKTFDESLIPQTKEDVKKSLLKRYNEDDFAINDKKELLKSFDSILSMIKLVLIAVAAISLVVGGIGVMNIMYVSVVERVLEIGVRRAYGAKKSDILIFFLVEAIILSLIGGFLGLGLSYVVVLIIHNFFPAYIDIASVLLAMGVSSGIGIIFGVLPARRAANLTQIEAIRSE